MGKIIPLKPKDAATASPTETTGKPDTQAAYMAFGLLGFALQLRRFSEEMHTVVLRFPPENRGRLHQVLAILDAELDRLQDKIHALSPKA